MQNRDLSVYKLDNRSRQIYYFIGGSLVIFIVVKFKTKLEWTDKWLDLINDFTLATREEPGNLWFEWSQSSEDPSTFVLVEAFEEDGAVPHVNSDHFKKAMSDMPQALAETPRIINTTIEGANDWSLMGELAVD
tara:strand:- start:107 stop:508 length:402 start_codon:yes stop_codon:yes gene_type:complete